LCERRRTREGGKDGERSQRFEMPAAEGRVAHGSLHAASSHTLHLRARLCGHSCDGPRDEHGQRKSIQNDRVSGLSWDWIAIQLVVPTVLGFLAAIPFWRKSEMIFGNIVGSGVFLAAAIALILNEYIVIDRVVKACLDEGRTCWPQPAAHMRFGIYACIGLAETFLLFTVSLAVERRISNRDYAPEWRR